MNGGKVRGRIGSKQRGSKASGERRARGGGGGPVGNQADRQKKGIIKSERQTQIQR